MLQKAKDWIKKAEIHLENEFSKLQLWRANPALVEDLMLESYWSMQPIKNVSSVSVMDAQTISIKPWDKTILHSIAKAIMEANVWLNPQTMADSIIIKIPALTEERRKEIVKVAKRLTEEAKVSIRNVRAENQKDIKKAEENKEISEDIERDMLDELQKLVDEWNKKLEELYKIKETDIMKI